MPTAQSPACLSPACYLHGRVSSSNLGGARPRGQRVTLRQVTGDTNKKNSIFQGCPTILLQSNLTRTRRWTNKRDTRASPSRITHSANPGIRRRPRLPCHGRETWRRRDMGRAASRRGRASTGSINLIAQSLRQPSRVSSRLVPTAPVSKCLSAVSSQV